MAAWAGAPLDLGSSAAPAGFRSITMTPVSGATIPKLHISCPGTVAIVACATGSALLLASLADSITRQVPVE